MHNAFVAVWRFRAFILAAVRAEFRGRFSRSRLGGLWHVLQPLAQAGIFALALTEVVRAKLPAAAGGAGYAFYLLAGMAAWTLFSEILNRCLNIFIEFSSLLKKISFPRMSLPVIVLLSALLNHGLLLVATAVILAMLGHFPNLYWLYLIPAIVTIAMLAFGIGLLLGVFNVFSRDVTQVMSVVTQAWFWLTPIVYPIEALPERIRGYVALNPMTALARIYQDAIAFDRPPDLLAAAPAFLLALALLGLALIVFRAASADVVDAL